MTSKFNLIYGSAEFEYTIPKAKDSTVSIHNNIGWSTIAFYVAVPTSGTVKLQGTYDDSNWFDLNIYTPGSVSAVTSTSTSGNYSADILGMRRCRIYVTSAGSVDGSVTGKMMKEQKYIDSQLEVGDIEIGAVEIKNATDNTRAVVKSDGTNNAVVVTQNSQPLPTGAATTYNQTNGTQKTQITDGTNEVGVVNNSQLKTTIYDSSGVPANVDDNTHSLQMITHEHHEIHEGNHYFVHDYVDLSNGSVRDIRFTTPNTAVILHFAYGLESENETRIILYETVSIVGEGITITPKNNDRNSDNTSDATFDYIDNTSTANADVDTDIRSATILENFILGSNQEGSNINRQNEIMLKANTTYSLRIIANSAGFTNYKLGWYEHAGLGQEEP